jgi:hypothetical protein
MYIAASLVTKEMANKIAIREVNPAAIIAAKSIKTYTIQTVRAASTANFPSHQPPIK